jgi:hypothetical protein
MKLSSITENLCLRVINTEACRTIAIVVVAFILSIPSVLAQDGVVRPSKVEARAAWDRGDFALAYEHYNGLLLLFSRDPLYKHFAGACLVKLEQDIPRAVTLLGSAINNSVNVKSVPDDVWFYYGRALQMNGSFTEAREAYNRFARLAGRKVSAEYDVQSYIDQCSRGQGALGREVVAVAARPSTAAKPSPAETVTAQRDPVADTKPPPAETVTARKDPVSDTKPPPAEVVSKQQVPAAVSRPSPAEAESKQQFPAATDLPAEYETVLTEALRLQHAADSILQTTGDAARAATLRSRADSLFMTLEEHEATPSEKADAREPEMLLPPHFFSDFEVRPSPAYNDKNPVPIDFKLPPGLVYTVQIAAFRNPVAPSLFKGLFPVFGGRRAGSDATYYYTGLFRRLEDAQQAIPGARGAGFPDAFVIAMMDGTQVSMERARLLEKEWSVKPLPGRDRVISTVTEPRADPAAPVRTLAFRAEVMRVNKPVKPEVIEKLELLAGTRGLELIKNNEGETVFLIGNFITFESADEYVSLLIRNGYSTARVAAYVGMHEIPVEAAKELLNRLHDD